MSKNEEEKKPWKGTECVPDPKYYHIPSNIEGSNLNISTFSNNTNA